MDNLERLIIDLKESLERQIAELDRKVTDGFADMRARFDTHSGRLDRHAGDIQAGKRWILRMDDWAEKIDAALEKKDLEIADLRERVRKLEQRNAA